MLNMGVLHLLGQRWQVAFLSSIVLAQLGEFSFVLGAAAIDHDIINSDIYRLIVAVTVLSLVSSPLYMTSARRLQHHSADHAKTLRQLLEIIYFREWRATRKVTARAVDATKQAASRARKLRSKDGGSGAAGNEPVPGAPPADSDAPPLESAPPDASNNAAPEQQANGKSDAELPHRKSTPRPNRGNRRGGARPVGRTGGGGGGDPEPGDASENTDGAP